MTKPTVILYHSQADLIWPEAPLRRNIGPTFFICEMVVLLDRFGGGGGGGKNGPESMKANICGVGTVRPPPPPPHVGWLKYKIHTSTHTCPASQKTGWKHVRFC